MKKKKEFKIVRTMVLMLLICCLFQISAAPCGDINSDGSIDIVDALLIAQYYVGLVSELSCSTVTPDPTGGCVTGLVNANEVLRIGDSWIEIPGTQHTHLRDLARAAGTIGSNEDYVDPAVSGSPIAAIVNQCYTREAGSVKVKVILMDAGGRVIAEEIWAIMKENCIAQ